MYTRSFGNYREAEVLKNIKIWIGAASDEYNFEEAKSISINRNQKIEEAKSQYVPLPSIALVILVIQ